MKRRTVLKLMAAPALLTLTRPGLAQAKDKEDLTTRRIGQAALQGDVQTLDVLRHQLRDSYVSQDESKLGNHLSSELRPDAITRRRGGITRAVERSAFGTACGRIELSDALKKLGF